MSGPREREHAPETEPWDEDETPRPDFLTLGGAVGRQGLLVIVFLRRVVTGDHEELALFRITTKGLDLAFVSYKRRSFDWITSY